ncbi:T9SS type B sorting domain-containing protein [Pseudofulvibacter geojedonensis]|uniref:T9SS type B sorting domain-containing protein n=1 Tax=Pseudofulvibacter geojedonensis TaxID=1123758 RepID=A0ABW3I3V2_9FLAO
MHLKKIHICFFILSTLLVNGQIVNCPEVVITDENSDQNININCNSQTGCVTLVANYPQTGVPTDYTVESIEYNPQYPYNGLAYPISVSVDDVWSDPKVSLPFNFCFYNQEYSEAVVSSNGAISFDLSNINDNGTNMSGGDAEAADFCPWQFDLPIPDANFPTNIEPKKITNAIYGVFHDIDPSEGGEIGWQVFGEYPCRALVVSYYQVPLFECTDVTSTFQMVLYEATNIIEVNIEQKSICTEWNGGRSLIGLQNANGTMGISPENRNTSAWETHNESWRFIPSGVANTSVSWYNTTNGNTFVSNDDEIVVCPENLTNYQVEVTYTLCNGIDITATDNTTVDYTNLVISHPPLLYETCDLDNISDGLITIDLNMFNSELITELNSINSTQINYFETELDAIDNISPISTQNNYLTNSNPEMIFGRIEDNLTNCVLIKPIEIAVNTGPNNFNVTTSNAFSNLHQITATVSGNGNYLFSINNQEFQEDGVFSNISPGSHTITIKDLEGCFFEVIEVALIDYPRFFSPNNDGINDTWNVIGINELLFIEINIFDRYNKFLARINNDSKRGWDGQYNDRPLPSDDYWFKIIYQEIQKPGIQQEFIGHFSLKR